MPKDWTAEPKYRKAKRTRNVKLHLEYQIAKYRTMLARNPSPFFRDWLLTTLKRYEERYKEYE